MNLSKFSRRRYTPFITPIEKLERFSAQFDGITVYMKRDDLLGLTGGGNKTRKLEFLMADALSQGADTIITCGAVQSNHCRLTLSASVKEGLHCHLVLEERVPDSYDQYASGNNFLYNLLGVEAVHVVKGGTNLMLEMEHIARKLEQAGRKPYIIPVGGSNETGALGCVSCAQEILQQTFEMGLKIDYIVVASGSSGTHAGILTGIIGQSANIPIIGIGVNRNKEEQIRAVHSLAVRISNTVGMKYTPLIEDVIVFDDYIGGGYSIPTEGMVDAVKMLARTEAILLDPVYTGKAMAGLIDLINKDYFKSNTNILFLHTGGSPALYAYTKDFFQ